MRRPLCAILASFLLAPCFLQAQDTKSQFSESRPLSTARADSTILDLLQQSHDLGQQLPVSFRVMNLLPEQAQMVSRLRPDLGRQWANELFDLSFQMQGAQQTSVQNTALRILVRLDPDRALELLPRLNIEEPVPKWAFSPPEMQLVQEVFEVLAARDGASALPLLEQEAERLGVHGHYPYAALGYAAMRATSRNWGEDNQSAIRVLQSVLDPAFARYSRSPHGFFDDMEFGGMLQVLAGGLPLESVQPALRMLVKNLLLTDPAAHQFGAEVYTTDGQTATVHNVVDATILFFGTLINRDPDLAEQLRSTRLELQQPLEFAKFGRQRTLALKPEGHARNLPSAQPEAETRLDAVRLSYINPQAAIKKAEELPVDDKRPGILLDVARGVAGDAPERAADLISEAQSGNHPPDDEFQLNLISAQAFVAAAQGRKDDLNELLERGYESANRVLLEQQNTGAVRFVPGLAPLVQLGIQNNANVTVAFLDGLSPSTLKARLLLGAAAALTMRMPLPFRSQPRQKVEKPADAVH